MPLHPLVVHFPIALLLIGTIAQLIALFKPDFFDKAATYLLTVGWLAGVVSYLTGEGAEDFAERTQGKEIDTLVHTHENLALASLVLFALVLLLKWLASRSPKGFWKPLVIVLCLAGSVAIGVAGHYGGKMVYELKGSSTPVKDVDSDE